MTTMFRFRKLTALVLIAALYLGSLSVMAVAMPSDVNGDGAVNTADVRALLLALTSERDLTEEERVAADVDGDGTVNTVDARVLLKQSLAPAEPTSTRPITSTTFASTRPTQTTQTTQTTTTYPTTTMPLTTTTTWVLTGPDGTAPTTFPTTTDTTMPDCDTTYTTTTYPTTMPYGSFTVTVDTVSARAGDTVTIPVKVSRDHALVGFEMDIVYDPSVLTLLEVNDEHRNPYATDLLPAMFNADAQWRVSKSEDGVAQLRYVSAAQDGALVGGKMLALTFRVREDALYNGSIAVAVLSHLSCANGVEYVPSVKVNYGAVNVTPRTTVTTTSGTTDTTYPTTTDTTYPPTTPSTEPIYWQTTTSGTTSTTAFDCVTTHTTYPTTLPYGTPLHFTGETVMARVGETVQWSVSVSNQHALVGLDLEICYDPTVLTPVTVDGDPVATYNTAVFDDRAQWRWSETEQGWLRLRYVSSADEGDIAGGKLFTLTFLLNPDMDVDVDATEVLIVPRSCLSAARGMDYIPYGGGTATDGVVKVASRSTRPKTTTVGTTDTTYPPTTTTTWVLTGPDGTAPTTVWTTTTTPPTMTD